MTTPDDVPTCGATNTDGDTCSRLPGHDGQHVAYRTFDMVRWGGKGER